MLKKRLIFSLLYNNGSFMLSRNFKLQRVGDYDWLAQNYKFSTIAFSIDELIIIDVTRENRDLSNFIEMIKKITKDCFVPITAGGGINSLQEASLLLKSGADKVLLNSLLYKNPEEVSAIANRFGNQSIVASVDLKKQDGDYKVLINNGVDDINISAKDWLKNISNMNIGEVYLNSINQDGTAQGLDLEMLDLLGTNFPVPLILSGGAGHHNHLYEAFADTRVDAVATAHLFNFVGDGLKQCREGLISKGMSLAKWEDFATINLK